MLRTIFRKVESDLVVNISSSNVLENCLGQQTVRWWRKPRWLPTAKSKLFKVPEKKKIPKEEETELQRLHNNYRTEMKSLKMFFAQKTRESLTGAEVIAELQRVAHDEHLACVKINEEWNKNIALQREEELAMDKEREFEEIIKSIEQNELLLKENKRIAEEIVREEKERAKTYITADNIDSAIDYALANPVDYDFAVDLDGNIYRGRNARPEKSRIIPVQAEQPQALTSTA